MKIHAKALEYVVSTFEVRAHKFEQTFVAHDRSATSCKHNESRAMARAVRLVRGRQARAEVWFLDRDDVYKPYIFLSAQRLAYRQDGEGESLIEEPCPKCCAEDILYHNCVQQLDYWSCNACKHEWAPQFKCPACGSHEILMTSVGECHKCGCDFE